MIIARRRGGLNPLDGHWRGHLGPELKHLQNTACREFGTGNSIGKADEVLDFG